jgi:hypothetical protein
MAGGSGGAASTTEIVTGLAALAGAASDAKPKADATATTIAMLFFGLLIFIAFCILCLAFHLYLVLWCFVPNWSELVRTG